MISFKKGVTTPMVHSLILVSLMFGVGCATVQVQAPKDPIKMDISMRLDVYQHVVKDIDSIESIVSGTRQSAFAEFLVTTAFAADLDPAVEAAAIRRRDRRDQVAAWQSQGLVGESRAGLLRIRGSVDASATSVIAQENQDRQLIYEALAAKNGTSVGDIQKVYSERLQQDAPAGTPLEGADGTWTPK